MRGYFPPKVLNEIKIFFEKVDLTDFQEFIDVTSSGKMYETIAEVANGRIETLTAPLTRGDAKTLMFHMLFSSNSGAHKNPEINRMKGVFKNELFPHVAGLFKIIKRSHNDIEQECQHNRLSVLLQSIESTIVLHGCCRRIWEQAGGKIPVFTIHDSIVTTVENVEFVERIMREELTYRIGVPPTLSVENWGLANLDQSVLQEAKSA